MIIDSKIIDLCKASDRAAQKQLYHLLLPYLNAVCKRYLRNTSYSNDVLQETFINLFMNLDQYDSGKGKFKTWAVRIAVNCCLKNNSRNKNNSIQELIPHKHEPKINPRILDKYSNEDLMFFLKKMPEQYFQIFNLHIIDGFSHKEISETLDIDESLSRKRLSRGRAWIEKHTKAKDITNLFIRKSLG